MDTKALINELRIFLKENKETFFLTISIVVVIVIILQVATYFLSSNNDTEMNDNLTHTHSFEIYIEQNNLGAYTNSYLLESFLKREDIVEEIEQKSDASILPVLEEYQENNEVITTSELDPINVERDTSTNVLTLSFGVGTNEENSSIAAAYYEWLNTTDFSFFDDKQVYFMSEPQATEDEQTIVQGNSFSVQGALIRVVLALFGGVVLGFVVSFVRTLIDKRIMYGFTYSWDENDTFLYFNNTSQLKVVTHSIIHPSYGNKVVLSEDKLSGNFVSELKQLADNKTNLIFSSEIEQIDPALEVNEFVLIIERNKTTKSWYQNQRKQLKGYHNPLIKIVQI